MTILIRKCTYLTFDLAVTLIRSFRRGIHPGALCHTQRVFLAWMPSINKKCHQNHFLGVLEITGCRLLVLIPDSTDLRPGLLSRLHIHHYTPLKILTFPTYPDYYSLVIKFNILGLSKFRFLRPVLLEEAKDIHK